MDKNIEMNPNLLVRFLGKPASEFTCDDIIRYCRENAVQFINLHYCGWDGKLKTLNFVINSAAHLESILQAGERVDGSSLFPFIEAGKSDLYVLPRYKTAFVNPFADVPTVDLLCSYFDREGNQFESSPQYILHKAHSEFTAVTGLKMQAMGELEYYVISEAEDLYLTPDQRGYHESAPFCKFQDLRTEAMKLIAQCGGLIKYGHSEVGNFTQDGKIYEQNEIEFLPTDIEDAADQLVVAKWVMRQLAYQYGVTLTFAPKITVGKAGSGMHVHCKFTRNGKSVMTKNGELTDECRKAIAGYMAAGTSLPAFGNPHPLSFMRLVPHQEAPTSRFADTYLLMAALCCAARHGFEMPDGLAVADKTYVGLGVNIHDEKNRAVQEALEQLPGCCVEAAKELAKDRAIYTSRGVFSDSIVDYLIKFLTDFHDETLRGQLDSKGLLKLVEESIDKG